MSNEITASLESEYEPTHDVTDETVVIGDSDCHISEDPVCSSPGDDKEKRF